MFSDHIRITLQSTTENEKTCKHEICLKQISKVRIKKRVILKQFKGLRRYPKGYFKTILKSMKIRASHGGNCL